MTILLLINWPLVRVRVGEPYTTTGYRFLGSPFLFCKGELLGFFGFGAIFAPIFLNFVTVARNIGCVRL